MPIISLAIILGSRGWKLLSAIPRSKIAIGIRNIEGVVHITIPKIATLYLVHIVRNLNSGDGSRSFEKYNHWGLIALGREMIVLVNNGPTIISSIGSTNNMREGGIVLPEAGNPSMISLGEDIQAHKK